MLSRSRDRGFYDPLSEMNRSFGRTFGGLMGPAEGAQRMTVVVGA